MPGAEAQTARKLAQLLPAGTVPGSSSLVTLDSTGIPVRALEGYRQAATLISAADPSCHLDWPLLAAIGRVESDHARFGGNQLDAAGVARPGIIGIPLDGSNGTARIMDTDRGLLDRDTTFDRAVGPMQFIPSTWRFAGVDANGDGVKDPQNMADSAAATGRYLCSGPGDLRRPEDLRSAILRYNASDSYARLVTAIANAYRHGVTALPAVDLAPASPATVASRTSTPVRRPAKAVTRRPASRPTTPPVRKPAVTPRVPAPATSTPASTQTTTRTGPPTTTTTTAPTCLPATLPAGAASTTSTAAPTSTAEATGTASPTSATSSTSTAAPAGAASPGATGPCVPSPCGTPTTATSTASPTVTASASTPAGSGTCVIAKATTGPSSTSTSAP